MARPRRVVVVGGGLAGGAAVHTLREDGFDGPLVLIGAESLAPYERPPLSKEYLRGARSLADLAFLEPSWYGEHDVDLRLGTRVTRLDPSRRRLELSDGETVAYDAALLATGALPLPPALLDATAGSPAAVDVDERRVLTLRTVADADRLRAYLAPGRHVVIVGAGFIGAEVAASARALGADVSMLELFDVPLERSLGAAVGGVVARLHREHGVDLRTGVRVRTLEAGRDGVRVGADADADADVEVEGDVVLVGLGVRPEVDLARDGGAATDDGVLVGPDCRTSLPDVFAAGDVARRQDGARRVRVEHWQNALRQGAAAARAILGSAVPDPAPHWFWSDQYDLNLQVAGLPDASQETVVRGSLDARDFLVFYLEAGVVRAVCAGNRGRELRRARRLIGRRVVAARLRDEAVDLQRLAGDA